MNNLFSDPLLGVGLPVLVGFCLLLLILIILDMRSIRSITLEEAYKVVRRSKEYRPLVAAAILINIFAWTIGRSSLEERVSPLTLFLYNSWDRFFVLLFYIGIFIRTSLAKERIQEIERHFRNK